MAHPPKTRVTLPSPSPTKVLTRFFLPDHWRSRPHLIPKKVLTNEGPRAPNDLSPPLVQPCLFSDYWASMDWLKPHPRKLRGSLMTWIYYCQTAIFLTTEVHYKSITLSRYKIHKIQADHQSPSKTANHWELYWLDLPHTHTFLCFHQTE